jgi:Trk-type K+ transport system membrane component
VVAVAFQIAFRAKMHDNDTEKNQVSRDFLHLIFGLLLWCASRFLCNYNNNCFFKIFFN